MPSSTQVLEQKTIPVTGRQFLSPDEFSSHRRKVLFSECHNNKVLVVGSNFLTHKTSKKKRFLINQNCLSAKKVPYDKSYSHPYFQLNWWAGRWDVKYCIESSWECFSMNKKGLAYFLWKKKCWIFVKYEIWKVKLMGTESNVEYITKISIYH